jgi:Zn-dependent protease with chaperone function
VTEEEWGALVERLERQAEANPSRYARKVLLFGLLGYAVLGAALLVLVGLAAGIAYLAATETLLIGKAIIPLAGLAWVIVRALGAKVDPPEGFALSASEAPALFEMIDDVRERVRGPHVHKVLIDGQFNASVVQLPRGLGLLGQRNYLILGLPYMQATSPEEFRAVVAHELGHLSRNHGRVSSWIYRIHATWYALLTALQQRPRLGTALFRGFFAWYQPRFEAYSFPLRRLHEFDADRAAADAAGAEPAATSLVTAVLGASYLDTEYWPRVYARAADEAAPPDVFRMLADGLPEARKHPRAAAWVDLALTRPTAPHDTHPSIAARIERLGLDTRTVVRAASAERNGMSAAQAFLGPLAGSVTAAIDIEWRSAVREQWRARHREVEEARARLAELDKQAQDQELPPEQATERYLLTEEVAGPEAALPLAEELLRRQPEDAPTVYAAGRLRLIQGDASGLELLERSMELDDEAIMPACETAFGFLVEQGRSEEAEAYKNRALARMQIVAAAQAERETTSEEDEFVRPDLPGEVVEKLRRSLAADYDVRRAYLVQKRVEHLSDELPLYIVLVIPKHPFRSAVFPKKDRPPLPERLVERIELPGGFRVIVPGPRNLLQKRIAAVPGAKVYER